VNQALNNQAFSILFDQSESVCVANEVVETASQPIDQVDLSKQYFCINALSGRRTDANVSVYRNFLLEFDQGTTDEQLELIWASKLPYSAITFSGNKSLHCIVSLEVPLINKFEYNSFVTQIYNRFPSCDKSCKNPSRLSRTPWATNAKTGKQQEPLELKSRVPNTELLNWLSTAHVAMLPNEHKQGIASLKKGQLAWATRQFLQHQAPAGEWHAAFYKVCIDFNEQGYSIEEAQSILEHMPVGPNFTGTLDANDLKDLRSAYAKEPRYAPRGSNDQVVVVSKKSGGGLSEVIEVLNAEFNSKALVYTDSQGNDTLLWLDSPTICRAITLKSLVPKAMQTLLENGYDSQSDQVIKTLQTWKDRLGEQNRLGKLPPSFTLDQNELSFNYIAISPTPAPTPTWDAFIGNCGANGEALMAFTWSILQREALHPQYVFFSDDGGTGKSCYLRWIEKLVGAKGVVSLNTEDPHWVAACVGRRLGIFAEVNNTSVVMNGQFKAITGNDSVTVTKKYQDAYSTRLDTKFILTSNSGVHVSSKDSERRRCILVKVEKYKEEIFDFEDKLAEETQAFLFNCKLAFEKLYDRKKKSIICDYELFDEHSFETESDFEEAFETRFKLNPESIIKSIDVTAECRLINTRPFFEKNFKAWLKRKPGVSYRRHDQTWSFFGLELKRGPK